MSIARAMNGVDGGGFIETALPQRSSAQMVMKYHAEDTSTLNGPRWFNRFRVGRAEPDVASFGRAVSMKPPWVPTRIVLSFLNHVFSLRLLDIDKHM